MKKSVSTQLYVTKALGNDNDFQVKDLDGTLVSSKASQSYAIVGNAYAERTDQPGEGITPRVIQYSNSCQIIKESFSVSDKIAFMLEKDFSKVTYSKIEKGSFTEIFIINP